jgi:hypothetical protein
LVRVIIRVWIDHVVVDFLSVDDLFRFQRSLCSTSQFARRPKLRVTQQRQGQPKIHSWVFCGGQSRLTIL